MSIKVGRLMGVPVQIHITWFAGFFLLTYIIAQSLYISLLSSIAIGSLIVALLYACIIAHECAHAFAARRCGVKTSAIILSAIGGEAVLSRNATCWADELRIASVGPIINALFALVFAMFVPVFAQSILLTNILLFLASSNALLAIINIIPGFPLDGGRVLRAILWGATGNRSKAATISTFVGKAIGAIIAVCGSVLLLTADWNGLLIVGLGWYMFDASARELESEDIRSILEHSHASDVLTTSLSQARADLLQSGVVDANENAWQVVERVSKLDDDGAVAVTETNRIVGLIEKRALPAMLNAKLRTAIR